MTFKPNHLSPHILAKGSEVELSIDKLAFGGQALGRVEGLVVFVEHALPGQRVRVRITRKKSQFAEARVVEVLEQSPAYTPPFCRHFGVCGGCQWQDLAYREQLHWKHVQVREALRHLAGLSPEAILAPVASPAAALLPQQDGVYLRPPELGAAGKLWRRKNRRRELRPGAARGRVF